MGKNRCLFSTTLAIAFGTGFRKKHCVKFGGRKGKARVYETGKGTGKKNRTKMKRGGKHEFQKGARQKKKVSRTQKKKELEEFSNE